MKQTKENLLLNNNVCLAVWDKDWNGYKIFGTAKEKIETDFIVNTGTWKFRVDSIYFRGTDAKAFSLVSGMPVYTLEAGENKSTEFRFN